MRIATWNVNSIRSRIDRVEAWLARTDVDVLLMQETKAKDEQFPYDHLHALGYEVAHHGLSQWNGVAIASRVGLEDVQVGFDGDPGWGEPLAAEARSIGATCGGIRLWSVYAPNGRALEDPHMVYKLEWLARLREQASEWASECAGADQRFPNPGTSRVRAGMHQPHERRRAVTLVSMRVRHRSHR